VTKQFSKWFGRGPQLALTTTFRCSQEICDVASGFVSKNPFQFEKPMHSVDTSPGRPVTVVLTDNENDAVVQILNRLSSEVVTDSLSRSGSEVASVKVLGRYGFQREVLPKGKWDGLSVTFMTVHGSKGLEADFVIVPGMSTGMYGFPSNVTDDPVLELAMPSPETYPQAEERRLFYVALTRARRGVFILVSPTLPSPFAVELLSDPHVVVQSSNGSSVIVCPLCKLGTLKEIHGPYDPFLGCTRFPICQHKQKVVCPECGQGTLARRYGPYGPFIGCSSYPACTHKAKFKSQQF
jgi:DNA helicase-4